MSTIGLVSKNFPERFAHVQIVDTRTLPSSHVCPSCTNISRVTTVNAGTHERGTEDAKCATMNAHTHTVKAV